MPWKSLFQICREVEQLPLRPSTPTEATELTGVLARHLGINPSEISLAALEAAWFTIPKCLEFVMHRDAREMKWFVSGRRSPDGKREVIRPDHWAFLTLDIEHQIARDLDGRLVYADLKGAFGNDLTEEEWQSVELQLAPPSPAPVSKDGTTGPTADAPQPDAGTPETRREKRARETKEMYERWYDRSQEIKEDNRSRRPIEIARLVAKKEKKAGYTKANAETIKRQLNEHYSGWAT